MGPEEIAAYWRQATATQHDFQLQFATPVVEVDRVAVEWWATMRDPDWYLEASSPEVTLPGCLLLRFVPNGRCAKLREYYNPHFGATLPARLGNVTPGISATGGPRFNHKLS